MPDRARLLNVEGKVGLTISGMLPAALRRDSTDTIFAGCQETHHLT
jgi:hypothetical protein